MKILHTPSELEAAGRGICVAIGVFDGVHLGHEQVIRQMLANAEQEEALPVVITFDQHPSSVVAPDRVPPLIQALPQRLRSIAALGVRTTWLIHFDEAFSRRTGEEFVRGMARGFGRVRSVCVGAEFTFGHQRSGDVPLLHRLGRELGFAVHGLAAVAHDGVPISSTRIREAIRTGQIEAASQMLGRTYALAGLVVQGDRLGRTLGFPTANLDTTGLVMPPTGVYAVQVRVRDRRHPAVLNIGYRPTFETPQPSLRVEAHLLGYHGDLYGQELEVFFDRKLREEQRFPSTEALKAQIATDIELARRCFEGASGA